MQFHKRLQSKSYQSPKNYQDQKLMRVLQNQTGNILKKSGLGIKDLALQQPLKLLHKTSSEPAALTSLRSLYTTPAYLKQPQKKNS